MGDAWWVARGVDTLIVNVFYTDEQGAPVKRELDRQRAAQLDEWKKMAQGQHEEVPTSYHFNGAVLHMCPNGAGRGQWSWMLKTLDLTLYLSRGQWNGIATVRLSSRFLWSSPSLLWAIVQVQELLDTIFGEEMYLQLSEVHLCVDIAGWCDVEKIDRSEHFVSRSRKRSTHLVPDWGYDASLQEHSYGLQSTGLSFSSGGAVSCVIYDKTREIGVSGKDWFEDLWRARGWSEEEGRVWRVELRLKREALHELLLDDGRHGVEDAYLLPELLPRLWAYGVGQVQGGPDGLPDGWLRCVVPSGDKNRSRLPTHPAWQVVQAAFQEPYEPPPQFGKTVRKRWEDRSIEKGVEAVMGYLTSLVAWASEEFPDEDIDLSVVLHWLMGRGVSYLARTGRDLSAEVRRKRLLCGV